MAENKTQRNNASVTAFINSVEDPERKRQAKAINTLLRKVTGEKPVMWGTAIVGYGDVTYKDSKGKPVAWFPIGFSPRKAAITLYLMAGLKANAALLKKLGPHKIGGGCLYLTKFDQIDEKVLSELIERSYQKNQELHANKEIL